MEENEIQIQDQGKIRIVRLNHPPANTLSPKVCRQLMDAFQRVPENIHVIILTGSEKFFSAGADIKLFSIHEPEKNDQYFNQIYTALHAVYNCPLPVIAAVNGVAMGGGMELSLCCDIRVVDENLRMGATSVNMGLVFCTQRLPRLIGVSRASELLLTARIFNGSQAQSLGIAHAVTPAGQAVDKALEIAGIIEQKPISCLKSIKKSLQEGSNISLPQALQQEQDKLSAAFRHPAFEQQITKFLQRKR